MVNISIIVSFAAKNFGIGYKNDLPWKIPKDLSRFAKITKNSVVVMGRNTWESLPEDKRPLSDRFNIVVTTSPCLYRSTDKVVFVTDEELDSFLYTQKYSNNIYIIGGSSVYKKYMGVANTILATVIENQTPPQCDVFFPIDKFEEYEIVEYSPSETTQEGITYRYITYIKKTKKHEEYEYLNLLRDIVQNGNTRPDRTGVGTISVFGRQMRFDISRSVPFLTTKFLAWKAVVKELLWFLSGKTDSKILESQGVNIWKGNTTREFLDNRGLSHYKEGDIGPLYGVSFRSFNCEYHGCEEDYKGQGYDQLTELIKGLKTDPYSRRHLLTTYNPAEVSKCVLAPCHGIAIQFYVEEIEGTKFLSCHTYCRSQDTFLGTSFNIASYAILTYIIAKKCSMHPKDLVFSTGDTHIYSNHLNQVKLQLTRKPLPFPVLEVSDSIKDKDWEDITIDDFNLVGYMHWAAIKAEMAV